MTREEAISEWTFRSNNMKKWLDECGEKPSIRHYVELIDMTIEALSDDAVSRKDTVTLNSPIIIQAEMVAVVRCKDCRYCTEYYDRDGYPYWMCDEWDGGTDADGFCHCGERKGGEDE